jgi:hypothetical protein
MKESGNSRWLDNGHKAFMQRTTDIKKDVASGKCNLWEKTCRKVSAMQREARMSEDQPAVLKHNVIRSLVWELQQRAASKNLLFVNGICRSSAGAVQLQVTVPDSKFGIRVSVAKMCMLLQSDVRLPFRVGRFNV